MGESPDANKRLEFQREKSEEKDKLVQYFHDICMNHDFLRR
jgi:hypothetical protein